MKADYQIAATALANGCEALYTGDDGLAKFARPHLPVVRIAEIFVLPEQAGLFE